MLLSKETCVRYLEQAIKKHRLEKFFTPRTIEIIAENAEKKLIDWEDRFETVFSMEEMTEYAYSMLLLSLYQIHILLDNSSSMHTEDRIATARTIIRNIVDVDSAIIEKGVIFHLLNSMAPEKNIGSADDFDSWFEHVKFQGLTKLGTVLKDKIWSKIIEDPAKFTRPCLVLLIIDGEPTGEPRSTFMESLLKCKNKLIANGYNPEAIAFGIVQVGTDRATQGFLHELAQIQELRDHLYIFNKNAVFGILDEPEELQKTLILKPLVGAIDTTGSAVVESQTEDTLVTITINGNTLSPNTAQTARDESKYILVQCRSLLSPSQMATLDAMGLIFHEYVSEKTYLYLNPNTNLDEIRRLDFVAYANTYCQEFKIDPFLRKCPPGDKFPYSKGPLVVDVVLHKDIDPESKVIQTLIAEKAHVEPGSLEFGTHNVRLTLEKEDLNDIASIDEVRHIELVHKVELRSNVALGILKAGGGQGFDDAEQDSTYGGKDQVVAVADTGFDTGHLHHTHAAFANRVVALHPMSKTPLVNDLTGHGTHVCGLVLGDGRDRNNNRIRGTAPEARLVVQCLGHSLDGIPVDFSLLFKHPYSFNNARVHTNSWGSFRTGEQLGYTKRAWYIDDFVYHNYDMVVCFAAGNRGADSNRDGVVDLGQIGAEAAAKNCITVGASENERLNVKDTYGDIWPSEFPKLPVSGYRIAGDRNRVAAFSSRGPTKDNRRYKPDVVAPGTEIYSAGSRHLGWPKWQNKRPERWRRLSGTSQACPLVAGCAAVLREAVLQNQKGTRSPSAALIKALLVNGAEPLSNVTPNNNSGFGRVNLANSLAMACKENGADFRVDKFRKPVKQKFPINIPDNSCLKVTLTWSDFPGEELTQKLRLIVRDKDRAERHGNMGALGGYDDDNNVQQVIWRNMPAGPANIVVWAYSIPQGPQFYAIVWRISRIG